MGLALLLPALGLAAAQAQPAGTIDCVYKGVAAQDILLVDAMEEKAEPSAAQKAALDRFTEGAKSCIAKHHWSEDQAEAAGTYSAARVRGEAAEAELVKLGVRAGFADAVAGEIGPDMVDAMVSRDLRSEEAEKFERVFQTQLAASGYSGAQDEESIGRIADLLGQALGARAVIRKASAQYEAG